MDRAVLRDHHPRPTVSYCYVAGKSRGAKSQQREEWEHAPPSRRPGRRAVLSFVVAWRRQPILITAALHGGAPGRPAIFPRWAFTDLLELRGDRDAGQVLRRNVDRVVRVPMPNAGLALDTPEDLLTLGAANAADGLL